MTIPAILLPVFAQVGLTFALLFWMARTRIGCLQRREVTMADIALGQDAWPKRATQIGNAFHNQLELPLLFYIVVILALLTRKADLLFVALAWLFVVTRLAHAYIHVTTNYVRHRFYVFAAGAVVLFVMWIALAVSILIAP